MTKAQKAERAEAVEWLREWLSVGDTVHCILRHVSSSGMTRVVQFVKMAPDGPRYLGYNIAEALGLAYDRKREGVRVQGCGMDMGFAVVYELGAKLWPGGFGIECARCHSRTSTTEELLTAQHYCPALDTSGKLKNNAGCEFHGRNGDTSGWDNDGGYALKCVWL